MTGDMRDFLRRENVSETGGCDVPADHRDPFHMARELWGIVTAEWSSGGASVRQQARHEVDCNDLIERSESVEACAGVQAMICGRLAMRSVGLFLSLSLLVAFLVPLIVVLAHAASIVASALISP